MSILIVLFGQENEADGRLRAPAAARCAKAAEVWKELSSGNEVWVLPTGAYGSHFNLSGEPHSHYLTRELIGHGVPPDRILPGVNSSNTIQDATEAWYRFKNGDHDRLVAVTSDYHAPRVAFILGRLNVNDSSDITVVSAPTPSDYQGQDQRIEEKKLERLKREWVDVIPRNSKVGPERFVAVYDNAGREFRHHSVLSAVVVAAFFLVNAFAFLYLPGNTGWMLVFLLLALAIIDGLLWLLYDRLAAAAQIARYVLTRTEIEHRLPGFSFNWRTHAAEWYRSPPWTWTLREIVTALAITLFAAVAIDSLANAGEYHEETSHSRAAATAANSSPSPTPAVTTNANAIDRFTNAMMSSQDNSNANENTNRRRRR